MSVLVDIKTGDPEASGARYQTAAYQLAYEQHAGDQLQFDAEAHAYTLPGGVRVPSVTELLRATGLATDFEALSDLGPRVASAVAAKRSLGSAVHADAHAFDDDDLDWSTVDPLVQPYLEAWVAFRTNYPHLRPAARERRVYHPALHYAGTLDAIFLVGHEPSVVISGRWSVELTPGRKVPYRVHPYDDWRDVEEWKARLYALRDRQVLKSQTGQGPFQESRTA